MGKFGYNHCYHLSHVSRIPLIPKVLLKMDTSRPLASSIFAPGIPEVMQDFGSNNINLASFVVSVYVLGYAFGPLIIAPMSELYGRLKVYHVCNVLFVIFSVACAVSSSLNMLIGFRFLAGIVGVCPLTIGGGSIADMIIQERRGRVMAIWALGPLMGPTIGPVVGGFVSHSIGWRWTFWIVSIAVRHSLDNVSAESHRVRLESLQLPLSSNYKKPIHQSSWLRKPIDFGRKRAIPISSRVSHSTSRLENCSSCLLFDRQSY